MTRSTRKGFGMDVGLASINKNTGDRMNRFVGSFARTASTPDGYDMRGFVPPITAGSMSALQSVADVEGTGNVLAGGPMEGAGAITFGQSGGLSLTVGLSGTAAVATLTGDSMVLRLTVGLDGTGSFSLTGTNNLALIVPFEGAGSVVTMGAGSTDLRGLLSMAGEWTPFTELSPEGLANAVWNSLATQYNEAGTMGNKLNTAGSGGVDYDALWASMPAATREAIAAAILAAAEVTPIEATTQDRVVEGAMTEVQALRLQNAILLGKVSGAGTGTETFRDINDTKNRIVATVDVNGNRTAITLDPS